MNVITVTLIIETFSEVHSSGDCPGFTPDSLIKFDAILYNRELLNLFWGDDSTLIIFCMVVSSRNYFAQ